MADWRSVRRVSTAEAVPALRSRRAAVGWLGLTSLACAALAISALAPSGPGLALSAVAVAVCEVLVHRREPIDIWALRRVGLGAVARELLRNLALVAFVARSSNSAWLVVSALAFAALASAAAVLRDGLAQVVSWQRRPPIMARNLAMPPLTAPSAPSRLFTQPLGMAAVFDAVAAVALAVGDAAHSTPLAAIGLAVAVALAWVAPTVLAAHALRLHRLRVRERVSTAVQQGLSALAPEVAVYFGNAAGWRYQVEMWLETLERVEQPTVVIVRDREVLQVLAPTSLPIVCAPGADTMMGLDLPSVRVALYVGNAGNNVNMLRRPGVCSVFIGHGDSDKGASFNPFSRVYDEIWVAGAAGRARYADADVRIAADQCVEVGRPQLRDVPREPDAVPLLTVLYAPTWEGWGEDPFHTSLTDFGPQLVRLLLQHPGVRVMYRPHPRTGHRDPDVRRAHQEVVRLLREAGAPPSAADLIGPFPSGRRSSDGDVLDAALRPRDASWSRAAHNAAVAEWNARFWAATPGHRVLTPPAPDLYACFGVTDVLVADVSSVTTDFLAADRPYAIVNVSGESEAEFRRRIPSTAGGFVLNGDLANLEELLVAAGGSDPTAPGRERAREYLLGPRTADPTQTFRGELKRLLS